MKKRRAFVAALGGGVADGGAWAADEGLAWAILSASDVAVIDAFRLKLQDLGYVEGTLWLHAVMPKGQAAAGSRSRTRCTCTRCDRGGGTANIAALQRARRRRSRS